MDTEIRKLKKITRFMQKQGILSLKTSEIEIELSPHAVLSHSPSPVLMTADGSLDDENPKFTEEDALLWSAPGVY